MTPCGINVTKKLGNLPSVIDFITRSKTLNDTVPVDSKGAINKFMELVDKHIFDIVKTKPIAGIQSIPAVFFKKENSKYLKSYLESIDIDTSDAAAMIHEWASYRASAENISKPRVHEVAKIATKNPLDLLVDEDGNLPPNVAFASMLAVADWLHKHPSDTVFISKWSRTQFMSSRGQAANLSNNELEQMSGLGHDYKNASTEIGNITLKLLGISEVSKDLGIEQYKENIVPALGMYALMTAHFKTKGKKIDVKTHQWKFDSDSPGRKFINGALYNHIIFTSNNESNENNKSISKAIPGIARGEDVSSTADILQEPATTISQGVRNFLGKLPKKIRDTIRKKQEQEWTTSSAIAPLMAIKNLGDEGIKLLHELSGVISEEDLGYERNGVFYPYNEAHYVSTTASNDDKKNAFKELFTAHEAEDTPLAKLYFKYGLAVTNRALQVGTKIFPQNSHIQRAFVQAVGSTKYTSTNMHLFKLAVLYNVGFSIDKATPEEVLAKFDEVQEDVNLLAAINELKKGNDANGKVLIEKIREFTETNTGGKPGNNIKILAAIHAMSKYTAANNGIKNEDKYNEFTSDITLEIDGITNGFAMTLLQFPMRALGGETLERRLNQTGTYLDKTAQHGINDDTYNDFAKLVSEFSSAETASEYILANEGRKNQFKALIEKYGKNNFDNVDNAVFEKNFKEAFNKRNSALYSIFPFVDKDNNLLREVVKYPFMIFNYSGGIKAITKGVASDVVNRAHETLNNLSRNLKGAIPKNSAKELVSFLNTAEEAGVTFLNPVKVNVTSLIGRLNKIINATGDPAQNEINGALNFLNQLEINEEISLDSISEILIPRFDLALTKMLGPIKNSTTQANQIAELMFAIFKSKLTAAENAKLKELNEKYGTEIKTLPDKEVALIAKGLERYVPRYSGALENSPVGTDADSVSAIFTDLMTAGLDEDNKNKLAVTVEYKPSAGESISSKSIIPSSKVYNSPGASAIIRAIINMEAAIMSETEGVYTDVLTTFDGVLGQPETLEKFSKEYGKNYLKLNRDVSIMQDMLDTLNANIEELKKTGEWESSIKVAANNWMEKNAFARVENNKRISFDNALAAVTITNDRVQADRKALFDTMNEGPGAISHQMFFTDMYPKFTAKKLTSEEILEDNKKTYFFKSSEYVINLHQKARDAARAAVKKGIGKDEKDPYLFNLNIALDAVAQIKQRLTGIIYQSEGIEKAIQTLSVLNEQSVLPLLRLTKETVEYTELEAFLNKLESSIATNKLIKATLVGGYGIAEIDAIQGKDKVELDRLKLALQGTFEMYHTLASKEMLSYFSDLDDAQAVEMQEFAEEFINADNVGERLSGFTSARTLDSVTDPVDEIISIDTTTKLTPEEIKEKAKNLPKVEKYDSAKEDQFVLTKWAEGQQVKVKAYSSMLIDGIEVVITKTVYNDWVINSRTNLTEEVYYHKPNGGYTAVEVETGMTVGNTSKGSELSLKELALTRILSQGIQQSRELISNNKRPDPSGPVITVLAKKPSDAAETGTDAAGVGTLGVELDRINPVETHSSTVTSNTINKLFHKFQEISAPYYTSKESKAAHTNALEKVLSAMSEGLDSVSNINLTVEKIDGITQGNYLDTLNRVRVSLSRTPPLAINGSTPQEVYVHEMLHALVNGTIRENPLLVIQLRKLFNQTKKELDSSGKHQVFLAGIDTPTEHDIAMAKEQYSYVFDNVKKKEPEQLEEFLVYAVTNRSMISYLSNTNLKLPVRNSKLLGKLQHVMDVLIDLAIRLLYKKFSRGSNAYVDALATMEYLIEAQNKHERLANSFQQRLSVKLTEEENKLSTFISEKATNILESSGDSKLAKIRDSVIGTVGLAMSENAKAQAIKQKLGRMLGKTARSIYNTYGKGVLSPELVMLLLKSRNLVGKTTQTVSRMSIEWFNDKLWKSTKGKDISHYTKEALTNVILRTGLSGLTKIQMEPIDIFNLLGSNQNIKKQKEKILLHLKLTVKDTAIKHAEELGIHAATGDSDANLGQLKNNGHTIAMQFMQNTVVQDAAKYLEAYATLVALDNTDDREIDAVKELSVAEFAKDPVNNGMTDILLYHATYTEKVLKDLFEGNPTQMRFGYVVEKVDNLHGMVVGKESEIETMKKAGYTEMYPLGDLGGVSESDNVLFVGRNIPENPFVSGVFSTAGRRHMGTSIKEILKSHPDYKKPNGGIDYPKINRVIKKLIIDDAAKSTSSVSSKKTNIRPLENDQGAIVDFRVIMNHDRKKKLLRPDLEFQNVFANMQSTLVGRVNTVSVDKAVVDSLVWEQINIMPTNKDLPFIDILDEDSPFYEQYLRLPREIREYMDKYTINGKFMVNADQIDQVFGYSAPTITNLKWVKRNPAVLKHARLAEYMLRQIVSYAKDRIVIATPAVVARNILSNTVNLTIRKIPFSYITNKYIEGYTEYRRYTKDLNEANVLKAKIDANKLSANSPESKQYVRLVQAVTANKIHGYSLLGLNSLIVEDVNTAATGGYVNRGLKFLEGTSAGKFLDNVPTSIKGVSKELIVAKSSVIYRGLQHVVQLSDFLARYVMIEYAVNVQKQPRNTAVMEAIEAFVLFDENLTPALHALDSTGALIFTAYALRNVRAVKALVKKHPGTTTLAAGGDILFGVDEISANILMGPVPRMFNYGDIIDVTADVTAFRIFSDAVSN